MLSQISFVAKAAIEQEDSDDSPHKHCKRRKDKSDGKKGHKHKHKHKGHKHKGHNHEVSTAICRIWQWSSPTRCRFTASILMQWHCRHGILPLASAHVTRARQRPTAPRLDGSCPVDARACRRSILVIEGDPTAGPHCQGITIRALEAARVLTANASSHLCD